MLTSTAIIKSTRMFEVKLRTAKISVNIDLITCTQNRETVTIMPNLRLVGVSLPIFDSSFNSI